eukprot:6459253-Amphidinium_carterae.1
MVNASPSGAECLASVESFAQVSIGERLPENSYSALHVEGAVADEDWGWRPALTQEAPASVATFSRPKRRQLENQMAIGGLRHPADSVLRLRAGHRAVGARLLAVLSRMLMEDAELR